MTRVAIVDDHPIACHGVASVLAEAGGFRVVAMVAAAADLTECLADPANRPDVVILDLYHEGPAAGIRAVEALVLSTRLLVMSASGRCEDVLAAVRAGAHGYITKQASAEQFGVAVHTVAAGGFWISSQLADILQAHAGRGGPGPVRLAPREEEALALIARGYTHAQTASRMGISKATVDTYVERIRVKLQVGNKAELTRVALSRLADRRPASW